jgi:hypothetical protein
LRPSRVFKSNRRPPAANSPAPMDPSNQSPRNCPVPTTPPNMSLNTLQYHFPGQHQLRILHFSRGTLPRHLLLGLKWSAALELPHFHSASDIARLANFPGQHPLRILHFSHGTLPRHLLLGLKWSAALELPHFHSASDIARLANFPEALDPTFVPNSSSMWWAS